MEKKGAALVPIESLKLREQAIIRIEDIAKENRHRNREIPSDQIENEVLSVVMKLRQNK